MKKVLIVLFTVFSSSLSFASPGVTDCDVRGVKLAKTIIRAEKMFLEPLAPYDGEIRRDLTSEIDQNGNVYQSVLVAWRVGPRQRIVSKYLWEEGNCTLISVEVN